MGIGVGIFLVALGAILAFAVHVTTSGFSINTIGIILLVVGVVGILVDLAIFMPRRRSVSTTSTTTGAYPAGSRVVEERQVF